MIIVIVLGVLLAAAVLAGAVGIALFPPLPRDLGGARNLDPEARRVPIPHADDEPLEGWWIPGTIPVTLLVLHGYGRTHHRAWRYAAFLRDAGYGIVTFDFRSSRTNGRRLPTTLGHHELPDAQAVLDWMRAAPELHGHRLGLFGESLGGSVGLVLAAANPDICCVVVDGGFAHSASAIEDSSAGWARLPRQPTANLARAVGRAFTGVDPGSLDVETAALLLRDRPVLFIHAGRDNRISEGQARRLTAAAGPGAALWIIPEAGHNEGWLVRREEYEKRVLEFLERGFVPAAAPV
jgi:fermentation-respiration switch protein FrsA (DUF1100 family)